MAWTQDQAIAFECACDTLTHEMAIRSAQLAAENAKASPDSALLAHLERELQALSQERNALSISDPDGVERVRKKYRITR